MPTTPSLTASAMGWMRDHLGLITTSKLLECGVSRRARDRLVGAEILLPVHKSVLRIASAPWTLEARCAALSMAHPAGFVTGPTAGRIVGLRRMPATDAIHFALPHPSRFDHGDTVVIRRSTRVDDGDVQRRPDGINIASPWRLAFDLAADLDPLDHASVIEQMLHDKRCGLGALRFAARRLVHPARPGSAAFLATLATRVPGRAVESHPELLIAKRLVERGVPVVVQETWLSLPNGRRARLDISVPDVRWGVEVDVHPDHLLLEGTTADKRRDRQSRLIGWQIERVTAIDLLDLDTAIDELVALYELRCDEVRARSSAAG
jgi:hypothetical protein